MKNLAILSLTILFSLTVMQSQAQVKQERAAVKDTKKELKSERKALARLVGTEVNPLAKSNFAKDFKGISNAQWRRDETFDVATFTLKGVKTEAFYDSDANLVGTIAPSTFASLPLRGQQLIKSQYKGYTVGKVYFYDDNEANDTDMMFYGTQFDDADNYFVELWNGPKHIVVEVSTDGMVVFFKNLAK